LVENSFAQTVPDGYRMSTVNKAVELKDSLISNLSRRSAHGVGIFEAVSRSFPILGIQTINDLIKVADGSDVLEKGNFFFFYQRKNNVLWLEIRQNHIFLPSRKRQPAPIVVPAPTIKVETLIVEKEVVKYTPFLVFQPAYQDWWVGYNWCFSSSDCGRYVHNFYSPHCRACFSIGRYCGGEYFYYSPTQDNENHTFYGCDPVFLTPRGNSGSYIPNGGNVNSGNNSSRGVSGSFSGNNGSSDRGQNAPRSTSGGSSGGNSSSGGGRGKR